MNHSESIKELAAALAKAQGEMGAAKMDATNPFLKNRYADLGSVIQAAKAPLASNGLSYTQHPSYTGNTVTISTLLMHASGEWIESELTLPVSDNKGLSAAQAMGAVITYLRRYTLAAILGMYADEDTDGNDTPKPQRQNATTPPPASTETPKIEHSAPVPTLKPLTPLVPVTPAPQAEAAPEGMTLEAAMNFKTSDTGELYGSMPTEKLALMANAITKKLRGDKPGTDEQQEVSRNKHAAITMILAHRDAKPA